MPLPGSEGKKGKLYLVATPIGNLEDITLRALRTFKSVDVIAAEDTRRTRKLLSFYDIHKPLVSFREHNSVFQGDKLLERLNAGEDIALCSDAGMPLISDPGEDFAARCVEEGIEFTIIPGPNAALSALVLSGMSTTTFLFLGFISRRKSKRKELLESVAALPHTLIFYESPQRVTSLLKDLIKHLGERRCCAVRELTKIHEEAIRGTFTEVLKEFEEKKPRGEFTVIVEGADPATPEETYFEREDLIKEAEEMIAKGEIKKTVFKALAKKYNVSKSAVYSIYQDYLDNREM